MSVESSDARIRANRRADKKRAGTAQRKASQAAYRERVRNDPVKVAERRAKDRERYQRTKEHIAARVKANFERNPEAKEKALARTRRYYQERKFFRTRLVQPTTLKSLQHQLKRWGVMDGSGRSLDYDREFREAADWYDRWFESLDGGEPVW